MPKIFLCHANEDKPQVRDVYQRLRAEGFAPWLDEEDLLPGQLWDQEIRKALRSSDFILIFFSQNSIAKRGYVQREMKLALKAWEEIPEGQIHTIPVRLNDCQIPDRFQRFHHVDLFDERSFEKIIRAMRLQQAQHEQQVAPRQLIEEEREGAIRSAIIKQIEVLQHAHGGPVVLYGDLTKQLPETFLTEDIVRVIEHLRIERIIDFDGPFAPQSTVIRLLPHWDSVENQQLRRLLIESEQALECGDPITAMAGTKVGFGAIVSAICAEYTDVADSTNSSKFQSFLFAVDKLGLSVRDARKCREITTEFILNMSEDGHWHIALLNNKTHEDYVREATFVLEFLARFIPPAQALYPDAIQRIDIGVPLTEQRLWEERRRNRKV